MIGQKVVAKLRNDYTYEAFSEQVAQYWEASVVFSGNISHLATRRFVHHSEVRKEDSTEWHRSQCCGFACADWFDSFAS